MPLRNGRHLLDPQGEQQSYDHTQRRRRIIGRIIVGFFAVVVAAAAVGTIGYEQISHKIKHVDVTKELPPSNQRPAKTSGNSGTGGGTSSSGGTPENVLILGVDSRLGEDSQYQTKVGPAQTEDLSDTAILAHLSGDGKHATLVSIPRDSVVKIPACEKVDSDDQPVLDSQGNPEYTKPITALFNEAIELGGPACSITTIESLTDVRIDHFLEIDFSGVVKMSDALGGVPLTMCNAIHDANTGLNLPAGPVNLEGQQALAFVRARYGLTGGSDLNRIKRQQQFMASMARKALNNTNFFDLPKMYTFLNAVAGSLTTDMGNGQLISLARHYQNIDADNIVFATVPNYLAPKGDQWYGHVYWETDEADALFTAIRNDQPLTTGSSGGTSNVATITVPPSQVSVEVLNGVGTDGLAGEVRDELTAAGFRVVGIGDASQLGQTKTTIAYAADHTDSMQTLSAALAVTPQAAVDSTAGSTVTLTVGTDWAGLKAAAPSASAPASPVASGSGAPSATASVPGVTTTNADNNSCVEG